MEVRRYIYDGDNIIAEYDGSGILITKYIFGPNIDEPIKGLSPQGTVPERYYHFDGLGSVTDLSNTSGQQVEHYVYNPFGKTKIYNASGVKLSDSAYGNYYRFTARQWDTESSLYYYRARMYDPKLGRFLQADPVGYKADINLYRYCGNNSLNRVDPRGLEGTKKTGKTGHITITRYAYPHGIPTIIISWHSANTSGGAGGVVLAFIDPATAGLVCLTAIVAGVIEWFVWVTTTDMEDSIPAIDNGFKHVQQPKIGSRPVLPVTIPPPLEPAPIWW